MSQLAFWYKAILLNLKRRRDAVWRDVTLCYGAYHKQIRGRELLQVVAPLRNCNRFLIQPHRRGRIIKERYLACPQQLRIISGLHLRRNRETMKCLLKIIVLMAAVSTIEVPFTV